MTWVADVSGCEAVTLVQALRGRADACRATLVPDGGLIEPRAMLWPCALPKAARLPHTRAAPIPEVPIYALRWASVGGPNGMAHFRASAVFADGVYPDWMKVMLEHDRLGPNPPPGVGEIRRIAGPVFSIGHLQALGRVYGHWLLEVFPKLFAIRRLADAGFRAPLVLPQTTPAFAFEAVRQVLPEHEVLTYDPVSGRVEADIVLLPGMMQAGYVFHPQLADGLAEFVGRLPPPAEETPAVFVSRAGRRGPASYRTLVNVDEIEAAAAQLGLRVVRPETLPWACQASLFGRARLIVGEYGSGLHNALFAGPDAKVVCLNWINPLQSRIAALRGHDVGYILAPDGRPRMDRVEDGPGEYRIDVGTFRSRMGPLLERVFAGAAGARAPLPLSSPDPDSSRPAVE